MDLVGIDRYCEELALHFQKRLDGLLESAHKIGSLAHGGFSPEYSDIDIALILKSEPPEGVMADAIETARGLDDALGKRISVFWSNRRFDFGRFPVLDRADLIDHAVCITGDPIGDWPRPSLAEVRSALLGHARGYWAEKTAHFQGAQRVLEAERKEFVRCLLYPARLLYTWDTGRLGSNDAAVEHLGRRNTTGALDLEPVKRALARRHGDGSFESLLPFSDKLGAQRRATLELLQDEAPT